MLSNYNHLSPELGIASPTSAFPSLPPLPPSIFDQPVDGGLFHRGNGSPKVSCHVSTGVDPEEDKTADIGLNAAAKPPRQNSPNGNQAASCHVGTDVNPEEDKTEASGVKAPAKPPRGMPPIRPGNSGLRFASSDFDLDFAKVSMTSPTESVEGERFLPVFRSGSCADMGPKSYMEDEHLCIDNLSLHLNAPPPDFPAPSSFYGVFDGHGGTDAACFVKGNLLKFIVEDNHFPNNIGKALKSAFINADYTLHDSNSLDKSSGTTVLTAIFFGRSLTIANAGDCRAVLGKRGRAVELTKDHKPNNKTEKLRIEKLGGTIFDGYLNGQLSVSRALGDWHLKGTKGSLYPLSAEPELHELVLNAEDEFLIIGCDGLWDVMSSQCAVTMVRKELMAHNDPEVCCRELVKEAINRNSCDNLTVLVVCFSPDPPPKIDVPRWRVRKSISMEGLHQIRGALAANEN